MIQLMNCQVLIAALLFAAPTPAAQQVTEIINASGDGMGNTLCGPRGVTATAAGDVYVEDVCIPGRAFVSIQLVENARVIAYVDSVGASFFRVSREDN